MLAGAYTPEGRYASEAGVEAREPSLSMFCGVGLGGVGLWSLILSDLLEVQVC